jgi:hypothetical protein
MGNYLYILVHGHPSANKKGYVLAHRFIMEKFIGRFLKKDEVVHHIDGNMENNSIENLLLMTRGEHTRLHLLKYKNGHFIELICDNCKKSFKREWRNRPLNGEKCFCSRKCMGLYWTKK